MRNSLASRKEDRLVPNKTVRIELHVQEIQFNYQDLKTEGFTLMILESGHMNCAMSHPEVRELRKSVLACHLLSAYNRYILSERDQKHILEKHKFHRIRCNWPPTSNVKLSILNLSDLPFKAFISFEDLIF